MKLIVSDLDGTFLNSKRQVPGANIAALRAAREKGMEIAIATGRNYGNVLELFRGTGLRPHVISNNGAFVYDREGQLLYAAGADEEHVRHAWEWLAGRNYFYALCTDLAVYMPANARMILLEDYQSASERVYTVSPDKLARDIDAFLGMKTVCLIEDFRQLFGQNLTFGNISAITLDAEKLRQGRSYFEHYQGLAMTIAGREIFEMLHPSVSKGNALEHLTARLAVPLPEVMAIGDHYNDISMLEKVGVSVAVDNAEDKVKEICRYISHSNDQNGVAHIVRKLLDGRLRTE